MKKSLWLPRCCCFGYEKEREREREGEGKWMALFRDFFFLYFSTEFFEFFLLFLANLKGILEFFLEFMLLTRFSSLSHVRIFGRSSTRGPAVLDKQ